ncbi:MAG: hypothetical protein METHAR1v1_1300004 [Methanothrix sp.]|nr:MAG: hypothetical protein METHAR1v1_1300004 [Methanothrix sp.]
MMTGGIDGSKDASRDEGLLDASDSWGQFSDEFIAEVLAASEEFKMGNCRRYETADDLLASPGHLLHRPARKACDPPVHLGDDHLPAIVHPVADDHILFSDPHGASFVALERKGLDLLELLVVSLLIGPDRDHERILRSPTYLNFRT